MEKIGWTTTVLSYKRKNVKMMKETETQSHKPFKFGDGKVVNSIKKVKTPVKIDNIKRNIKPEVLPTNPLPLSKTSMEKAGTVLDMEKERRSDVQPACQTEL